MQGKKNPKCPAKEPASNPPVTMERVRTQGSPIGYFHLSSWLRSRRVGLNGIAGSESQICQRGEHLRARQYIGGASLREGTLRGSYIQQGADTVVVRFQSRGVGLAGGFQERNGCLALAKGGVQIGVSRPNLVGDSIVRNVDLCFCRVNVSQRLRQLVFSRAPIEYGPPEIEDQSASQIRRVRPGQLLL